MIKSNTKMPSKLSPLQREMLHALLDSGVTIEDILNELQLQVQFLPQSAANSTPEESSNAGVEPVVENNLQIGNISSLGSSITSQIKTQSYDGLPQQQTEVTGQLTDSITGDDPSEENQDFDEDEEDDDDDQLIDYGPMDTGSLRDQLLR